VRCSLTHRPHTLPDWQYTWIFALAVIVAFVECCGIGANVLVVRRGVSLVGVNLPLGSLDFHLVSHLRISHHVWLPFNFGATPQRVCQQDVSTAPPPSPCQT